jgi:hypothetical protein
MWDPGLTPCDREVTWRSSWLSQDENEYWLDKSWSSIHNFAIRDPNVDSIYLRWHGHRLRTCYPKHTRSPLAQQTSLVDTEECNIEILCRCPLLLAPQSSIQFEAPLSIYQDLHQIASSPLPPKTASFVAE